MSVRKFCFILPILVLSIPLLAQRSEYQDKYIGWKTIFTTDTSSKPTVYDHRVISAKQSRTAGMFRQWMQASYTPKGGLGDIKKRANEKLGLYNQYTKAMPNFYGASASVYISLKKGAAGKYTNTDLTGWSWNIFANGPIGVNFDVLTTPEQYYFYLPHETGTNEIIDQISKLGQFNTHPVHRKYFAYYHPKDITSTLKYVVVLSKDNQKFYTQITKGECLDQLGRAIERNYEAKINKIKNDQASDEKGKKKFFDYEKEAYDRRIIAFKKLREKYRNRLDEPAAVYSEQPSLYLENSLPDLFEGFGPADRKITVYKYKPDIIALCQTDNPQWIVVEWSAEGVANDDPSGVHIHESILRNFDFDYVYNYFFYREKVNGQSYKPLRPPGAVK
jgi:hypothetical protein